MEQPAEFWFFTAQPFYDGAGVGFGIGSPVHLAYFAVSVLAICLLVKVFERLPKGLDWGSPRRKMLLVVGTIPVTLVCINDLIMCAAGVFSPQWWPLHVCNFSELFLLIYALRPNKFCGECIVTIGIVGASCALAFANWWYCPAWSYPAVVGFVEHALIIAFGLMISLGGEHELSLRNIWRPLVFLGVYAPVFYAFNKVHDTNFLFLNGPAAGSPMEAAADVLGNPGYVPVFLALFAASWLVVYGLLYARKRWIAHNSNA